MEGTRDEEYQIRVALQALRGTDGVRLVEKLLAIKIARATGKLRGADAPDVFRAQGAVNALVGLQDDITQPPRRRQGE